MSKRLEISYNYVIGYDIESEDTSCLIVHRGVEGKDDVGKKYSTVNRFMGREAVVMYELLMGARKLDSINIEKGAI